jgi:hypothetical protein
VEQSVRVRRAHSRMPPEPDRSVPEPNVGYPMKSIFQNILLVVLSTVFAVLIAEFSLRISGFGSGNPFERLINHNDELLGYRMVPGMQEMIKGPDGHYSVEIVSLGFDDGIGFRDDGLTKPVHSIFIGDSFTWGWGVDLEDSVSERFEQLNGEDSVNLGMTSWTSPTQYARIFSKYGTELKPKYVLIGFFLGNDFHDTLDFADWVVSGKTMSYPMWHTLRYKKQISGHWIVPIKQVLYKHSSLARFIGERINFTEAEFRERFVHVTTDSLALNLDRNGLFTEWKKRSPERSQYFVRSALNDIKKTGRRHNISVVVFIIPTKEMVYQSLFPDPALRDVVDLRYSKLLEILNDLEITYINLLPEFRNAASRGEQLYFEYDGHWNPDGHLLAAKLIREFLNASK